jgi:hypothetical protein
MQSQGCFLPLGPIRNFQSRMPSAFIRGPLPACRRSFSGGASFSDEGSPFFYKKKSIDYSILYFNIF